jgi:phospholipase C
LIFIVQENRSFDQYFGTYPGADGIPMKHGKPSVCIPDPVLNNKCLPPYHSTDVQDVGGPHSKPQFDIDVNHGKMDGFIRSGMLQDNTCLFHPTISACKGKVGPQLQPEIISYHNQHEIPNYWKYADNYVLQDHMFSAADSWTLPAHLFLVSAW